MIVALIPSFNAGSYLRASVLSLLQQTKVPDRIIVIDDASTDGSIEHVADLEEDRKIEIHRNPINLGKAEALNHAFNHIDADYFILQDADDISLPHRVERQVAFMDSNAKLGCSSSFIQYINKKGDSIGTGRLDLISEDKLKDYLTGDEPFGLFCPSVILRSKVVRNPELQFRGRFWPADDIDLWNRIAEAGWLVQAQPEVLVQYRIHGSSVVSSNFIRARMQFEWVRACLRARRKCQPEPDHEEFTKSWNSISLIHRMNRSRKIVSKGLYRSGGFAVAERKYLSAFMLLCGAIILDPKYSVSRLIRQISKN